MQSSSPRPNSASLSIPPWQQLVEPVDLVVGNATENISQPCLWINTVELGRFDQRVGNANKMKRIFQGMMVSDAGDFSFLTRIDRHSLD
jgi:hypothetical protein